MRVIIRCEQDREKALRFLRNVSLEAERQYTFECKRYFRQRSIPQNRLRRMWVAAIAADRGGHDKEFVEMVDKELRLMFLPHRDVRFRGRDLQLPMSTKDLDVKEFSEFLDNIYNWATNEGIMLLQPEDRNFELFRLEYEDKAGV